VIEGPSDTVSGLIEFRHLTFAYDAKSAPVLRDISLTIPPGKKCGIIGELGSGKSTLVHLLLRLFEPPKGTVWMDGIDVTEVPLARLQESIGFVSQDIFLFSGTIRENLLLGSADGEEKRIESAAQVAELLPTIQEFKNGFETVIGERGVRLSGGQKQRAALARAIIKDPPVLVLDDAFSSVDVETEEKILTELKTFMEGRTTLLISHRISTVRAADFIVYLRAGEIIEQGSHDELLALRGAYYELYQRQRLVEQVETMNHREIVT
jgi:ATP-binding cassette subfamily B protein